MIRIGIGITTYMRKENMEALMHSINHNTNIPYTLFFAVDGSTDGTDAILQAYRKEYTYGPNVGPEQNKNRIFRRFSQYNYIIIIDDDMLITNPKWFYR